MVTLTADSALKLYVCFSGIVISASSLFQPDSPAAKVLAASGVAAPYVMGALLLAAVIGLADVFINDCLQREYSFEQGLKHRTWTLAAIGFIHMLMLFVIVSHNSINWVAGRFVVDGSAAAIAMLMDVQARYVGPRRGRRAVDHAVRVGS